MSNKEIVNLAKQQVKGRRFKLIVQVIMSAVLNGLIMSIIPSEEIGALITSLLTMFFVRNVIRAILQDIRQSDDETIGYLNLFEGFGLTPGRYLISAFIFNVVGIVIYVIWSFIPPLFNYNDLITFLIWVVFFFGAAWLTLTFAQVFNLDIDDPSGEKSIGQLFTESKDLLEGNRWQLFSLGVRQILFPIILFAFSVMVWFVSLFAGGAAVDQMPEAVPAFEAVIIISFIVFILALIWIYYLIPQVMYSQAIFYQNLIGDDIKDVEQ